MARESGLIRAPFFTEKRWILVDFVFFQFSRVFLCFQRVFYACYTCVLRVFYDVYSGVIVMIMVFTAL